MQTGNERLEADTIVDKIRGGEMTVVEAVAMTRTIEPQGEMHNSTAQLRNLWGAFSITSPVEGDCLLIDDRIDSRWTVTVVARELRLAGCQRVVPVALAGNG